MPRPDGEPVRGRMRMEFNNVESVNLWGWRGADPDDDHHHVQIRREGGGTQSARVSRDGFERIEALLKEGGR